MTTKWYHRLERPVDENRVSVFVTSPLHSSTNGCRAYWASSYVLDLVYEGPTIQALLESCIIPLIIKRRVILMISSLSGASPGFDGLQVSCDQIDGLLWLAITIRDIPSILFAVGRNDRRMCIITQTPRVHSMGIDVIDLNSLLRFHSFLSSPLGTPSYFRQSSKSHDTMRQM
jgi:hypothetical protein